MTRGHLVWLAILSAALVVGLLLRTPKRTRDADDDARATASGAPRNTEELVDVELERDDAGAAAPSASGAETSSEAEFLRLLESTWKREPERAVTLAAEGDRRFGESPRAVERRLYEIKALVELGRIGNARTKATRYLELYPPGPMTAEVERLTGVHRRPAPDAR